MPIEKKDCFVVGPIGAADSPVRIHADWLLEEVIDPVMAAYPDFTVHRADKLSQPGLIDTQVITHLLNDHLVIADMTTLNPNAFYEIGIRHMAQKPIIHMHKAGEKIPFDVSAYRSIEFSLEKPGDLREARKRLASAVDAIFASEYKVDNPVTHARGVVDLQERATDAQRVLLDEIEGLKERLNSIEKKPANYVFVDPSGADFDVLHFTGHGAKKRSSARTALSSVFSSSYPDPSNTLESWAEEKGKTKNTLPEGRFDESGGEGS